MRQLKHDKSIGGKLQASPTRRSDDGIVAALFQGEIETVITYWLDSSDHSFERWDLASGTLLVNPRNKTIRFGVRPVGQVTIDPFEVVILHTAKGWAFKADCYEDADTVSPLRVFKGPHSILFVFNGKRDIAYFHVEMACQQGVGIDGEKR